MYYESYLTHHGIRGQKWGRRRFQNADGSYTSAEKKRYDVGNLKAAKAAKKAADKEYGKSFNKWYRDGSLHLTKAGHANHDKLTKDMQEKARKSNAADVAYKKEKKAFKEAKKEAQREWKENRKDYNATKSTGRNVANFLINGPTGAYTYNSMRAAGHGRLVSEGATIASSLLGGPIGNAVAASIVGHDWKDRN